MKKYIFVPKISYRSDVKPEIKVYAKKLRKNPTPQEEILWRYLRRKRTGLRFKRQVIFRGFIVDFYCPFIKLIIEVDGSSHNGREGYDNWRSNIIRSLKLKIIRFKNEEIDNNIIEVIKKINDIIYLLSPL